jgi:hypothetical protein
MFEQVARDYADRTPDGYPAIVDEPDRGAVGIQLDPAHSLFLVSDGTNLFADFSYRSARTDARSSASREKFSGTPFFDRRPLDPGISDQGLRNLLSELISRWNMQPLIIHITDT